MKTNIREPTDKCSPCSSQAAQQQMQPYTLVRKEAWHTSYCENKHLNLQYRLQNYYDTYEEFIMFYCF